MESILIGQIVNTHGIKGEVKIYPYTDDINNLTKLKELYLDENLNFKYNITMCRVHKDMLIVKFKEINDANKALELKTKYVYIDKSNLKELEDDCYYIEDLLGIEVIDEKSGDIIGTISYVFNTGANDVYEIQNLDGKKVYIPAIKQVIKSVDIDSKKMYIELMEGLI